MYMTTCVGGSVCVACFYLVCYRRFSRLPSFQIQSTVRQNQLNSNKLRCSFLYSICATHNKLCVLHSHRKIFQMDRHGCFLSALSVCGCCGFSFTSQLLNFINSIFPAFGFLLKMYLILSLMKQRAILLHKTISVCHPLFVV